MADDRCELELGRKRSPLMAEGAKASKEEMFGPEASEVGSSKSMTGLLGGNAE